ncbi:MAG: hypothetical protein A2163_07170 [Actinobacteria bacterium RBG_13_35_12]|nr:MAG: hypothetical protein A2163_07170 [Actinobacteria bacterium RBG_13_35_12]
MININGIQTCQAPWEIKVFKEELKKVGIGNMAEVGVYMGGTAKIMAEMCPISEIYLFDTFEGLPYIDKENGDGLTEHLKIGDMKEATLEIAEKNLKQFKNIHIYKGIFPETSEPIKDKKFIFVHIDTDIYQATKEALEFFYPRTNGTIIIHDYKHHKGVSKATDEFCQEKGLKIEVRSPRQGIIRI